LIRRHANGCPQTARRRYKIGRIFALELESSWNTAGASPRRYYRLNAEGERLFAAMSESWRHQVDVMDALLK
jgi:hypothetical protein